MRTFRRVFIVAVLILTVASLGASLAVRLATTELVSPPRRALQDYHHEWMNHPASHGIQIQKVACLGGQVPCLAIQADRAIGPGSRGSTIREQLKNKGINLPEFGEIRANLVLLHGRHGRKEDMLPIAERFSAVGFRCIVPDLPAHGESPISSVNFGGSPFESALASTVLHEVTAQFPTERLPSALWAISMGGAYAISAAAGHQEDWYSLVIVNSFDTLSELLEEQCNRRVGPLGPAFAAAVTKNARRRTGLDVHSIRPAQWAQEIHIPVLIVHGTRDALIAPERGRALIAGFASRQKEWIDVENGDHHNVLITPMPLYAEMAGWLLQHLPSTNTMTSQSGEGWR